jgi:hypothetical protein
MKTIVENQNVLEPVTSYFGQVQTIEQIDSPYIKRVKFIETPDGMCKTNMCCGCISDSGSDSDCCCDSR